MVDEMQSIWCGAGCIKMALGNIKHTRDLAYTDSRYTFEESQPIGLDFIGR